MRLFFSTLSSSGMASLNPGIHSLTQQLLSISYAPGTLMSTGKMAINNKKSSLEEFT